MSLPQFLVPTEALNGSSVTLTGHELKHFFVRRIHIGEQILLTDGHGLQLQGTVIEISPAAAIITDLRKNSEQHEYNISLAVACIKGDRLDTVVEKATEIGVDEIRLFHAARSIARPSIHRVGRLQRIAQSATKQSGRSTTPRIVEPVGFSAILRTVGFSRRVLFHESIESQFLTIPGPDLGPLLLIIGPEGGFAEDELSSAMESGTELVGLGTNPLRSDTAAIVALTLARYGFKDPPAAKP